MSSKQAWREVNFDGLVGPSHNYGGLSFGNLASITHQGNVSRPRQAALQGLDKMRWLMERGFTQGVLPPQQRPDVVTLSKLGFRGSPRDILASAWQQAPHLFSMCSSASSMWVANAATVVPSCDIDEGRCVLMPANLISHLHRSLEVANTRALLSHVFADTRYFRVTAPLPPVAALSDEGAANHMRLALSGQPALHVLVYGADVGSGVQPRRYPPRQTREACIALARLAGLEQEQLLLVKQNPDAIDAGVFHNDVIAVSHDNILLCHEQAFLNQDQVLDELQQRSRDQLQIVQVMEEELGLQQAVVSYLFNSQILGPAGQRMLLLPVECERDPQVRDYIENRLRPQLELEEIAYLDLQQSMRNGGGPACLRLRLVLSERELDAMQGKLILDQRRHQALVDLVTRLYPEELTLDQLASWSMAQRMTEIQREIYRILELPLSLLDPFQ